MKRATGGGNTATNPNNAIAAAATTIASNGLTPTTMSATGNTTTTTSTTPAGGGIQLNRRRGTSTSARHKWNSLQSPLQILAIIAVSLTLLLGILFISYQANTPVKKVPNRHVMEKLPGVPNLLRGNIDPIRHGNNNNNNSPVLPDDARHLLQNKPPQRTVELHNNDHRIGRQEQPEQQEQNNDSKEKNMYDNEPTELYPYNLDVVPDGYTVANDYRVLGGKRFMEYTTGGTPYLVTDDVIARSDEQARSRRTYVKNTMKFAWDNYEQYAYGADELAPQSARRSERWGGQGVTLVDALDTLWLMGFKTEFYKARDWIKNNLHHEHVGSVSMFETTIRDLGGLLSAYDWSGEAIFLDKALELGERLLRSFDGSSTGIPFGTVDLSGGYAGNQGWTGNSAILAEFGTIQIEFQYLAMATNKTYLAEKPNRVFEIMNKIAPGNGLYPYFWANSRGDTPYATNDKITFGAMADSFYEYMLKSWLQHDKQVPMYREMYDKAMDGMHNELLQNSVPSGLRYIADKNGGSLDHKMDHLVCFMGGLLALGAYTDPNGLESPRAQRDLRTGKALTYTCYQMYARMNTGISAEYVQFERGNDFVIGRGAPHYLLRPEAVESFFILNYLTKDPIYREWGWEVYQSIEKYCKAKYGYGALSNVQDTHQQPRDSMESFFLAETLKYLYLLQDPDTEVDILHKHVFNTEAHPVRIISQMFQPRKIDGEVK